MEQQPTTSSASENPEKFVVQLRHKKCCVIKKTRTQISKFGDKYENGENSSGTLGSRFVFNRYMICFVLIVAKFCRLNKLCTFLRKNRIGLAVIIFCLLMGWLCIMYGAVLGATSCSHNDEVITPFINIPGLRWTKQPNTKVWKVF